LNSKCRLKEIMTVMLVSTRSAGATAMAPATLWKSIFFLLAVAVVVNVKETVQHTPVHFAIEKQLGKTPPTTDSTTTSVQNILQESETFYYVHIPKTGGTSINKKLEADLGSTIFYVVGKEERGHYVHHKNEKTFQIYQSMVSTNQTTNSSRRIFLSAEHGIDYLMWHHNDEKQGFGNTFFFSAIRNPYDWVLSAANHMQIPLGSDQGYFDIPNIQTRMTGYNKYLQVQQKQQQQSGFPDFHMCLCTLDSIDQVIEPIYNKILGCDNNKTYSLDVKVNTKPHNTTRTTELERIVQARYSEDLTLYNDVVNHNGILCW
jgi:hypothetical protein